MRQQPWGSLGGMRRAVIVTEARQPRTVAAAFPTGQPLGNPRQIPVSQSRQIQRTAPWSAHHPDQHLADQPVELRSFGRGQ
jgi:hypothetical protein